MPDHPSLHPQLSQVFSRPAEEKGKPEPLPHDLAKDVPQRLQFLSLFFLVVSAVNLMLTILSGQASLVRIVGIVVTWLVCGLVYLVARGPMLSTRGLLNVAFGFEVFIAALITVGSVELIWYIDGRPPLLWSPVAVIILIFPMIVPNTRERVIAASVLAALAEPAVAYGLAGTLGFATPTVGELMRNSWPNVVAATGAFLFWQELYRLGAKLAQVRSMGAYHLLEKLGVGGMGEVWKAKHNMLARPAAVKLIRPAAMGATDTRKAGTARERFQREAQVTAALRSPHTIELYDYGVSRDGTFYYVMELLDGLDLQTLIDDHGPQTPERTVKILRQACHSLYEAHEAGITHRDIKPANIFLCRYGTDLDFVKVLDFGLVKHRATEKADGKLTQEGVIAGTPAFLPPEMGLNEGTIDGRTDIYALGCVAYWLLTGGLIFDGSSMAMVVSHARDVPPPLSERSDQEIPEGLERIVMRCLEKDPANRPPNAKALSDALAAVGIEDRWTPEREKEWWEAYGK